MKTFLIILGVLWLLGSVALPAITLPTAGGLTAHAAAADAVR